MNQIYFLTFIFSYFYANAQPDYTSACPCTEKNHSADLLNTCQARANTGYYLQEHGEASKTRSGQWRIINSEKLSSLFAFTPSQGQLQQQNVLHLAFKNQQKPGFPVLELRIGFNDSYNRTLMLVFREDSSSGADGSMEGKIYSLLDNDISWLIEEAFYSIQVRPLRKNDKIPLFISLQETVSLSINLNSSGFLTGQNIFLYDAKTNTYTPMDAGLIVLKLEKGEYNNRFFISFMKEKIP